MTTPNWAHLRAAAFNQLPVLLMNGLYTTATILTPSMHKDIGWGLAIWLIAILWIAIRYMELKHEDQAIEQAKQATRDNMVLLANKRIRDEFPRGDNANA